VEVLRSNMSSGTPDFDTRAGSSHEAGTPVEFDLSSYTGTLVTGTNVLSIEGHNRGIGSSDFSIIPELVIESTIGGGPTDTTLPTVTITSPTTTTTYTASSSNLNIGGTASDDTGVTQVTWSNDRGGSGTAIGTTSWSADGIALKSGDNVITVTARDAAGNTGTDILTVAYNPSDTTPPTTPANLTCTAVSSSQIDLFWDASTDNVGVDHYNIYRDGSSTPIDTATGTSYSDTGLTSSTTYTYNITAVDAVGNESAQSNSASDTTFDNGTPQTVTVINVGDTWNYFKGTSNPGAGWNDLGFNDTGWLQGPTGIGYGDGDDATVLSDMRNNYLTVYGRKTFNVTNASAVTGMTLSMDWDDGFAAYINGVEVARSNMPAGTPDYNTRAASSHEAGAPVEFDLGSYISNLVAGTNVLSIEGHNRGIGSSDFSMIPELVIESQ
jgi:chitodextrinase